MQRRILILGTLVGAVMIVGCNRPDSGWRDRNQEQAEPTQAGSVSLPPVENDSIEDGDALLDQLDSLLEDLEESLSTESDWQLDVPEENDVNLEDEGNAAILDDLLSQLETSLLSLDSALASETAQQLDPP